MAQHQLAQPCLVRAASDHDEHRVGHLPADQRQSPDQHVLTLARDQPGHTQDDPLALQAELGPQRGPGVRVGPVHLRVDPRHQAAHPRTRTEGRLDPGPRVLAEIRDDIHALTDAAHQTACTGCPGPPDLMAVGGRHHAPYAAAAQRRRHQGERRGGPEPDPVAVMGSGYLDRPARDPPGRQQHAAGVTYDRKRERRVVGGVTRLARRVDHHVVVRYPRRHRVHEGLDASLTRREIVGDDKGGAHECVGSFSWMGSSEP